MNESAEIDYFYALSVALTGYSLVHLYGTGQGEQYYATLREILGEKIVSELLNKYAKENEGGDASLPLLQDNKWGPVCRNIIKMWYMGNWYQMPTEWREAYVYSTLDVTKVISTNAYKEGLVWKAMGQHPKSAKQPGYGTWAFQP